MASRLQTLLGIDSPLFESVMLGLEKSTGNNGVDTRLIADILEKAHQVMRVLGLDTTDTTGHELYLSLIAAVKSDDIEALLSDVDYVLYVIDGKIISFNLIDVIENAHHELTYENQTVAHGQRSLRGELVGRYVGHPRTDEQATIQAAASIGLGSVL